MAVQDKDAVVERPAEQASGLPLFYRDPRPVARDRHKDKSLKATVNLAFAASSNSVPLTVEEMSVACRDYPIAFSMEKPAVPVAVLGFRRGENLFVDGQGQWAENRYLPGYIRRYPFIFMEMKEENKFMLCVDEASGLITDGGDRRMFDGEEPSELTKKALEFCAAYHRQFMFTRAFSEALEQKGLLTENSANVALPGGKTVALQGIRQIDEKKFRELDDATLLAWHKNGFLFACHAHFISQGNWNTLAQRLGRMMRTAAAGRA